MDISTRPEELVKLPFGENCYICPTTLHRFTKSEDERGEAWTRDYHGESDWEKMASYVSKTYEEVAQQELQYAVSDTDIS